MNSLISDPRSQYPKPPYSREKQPPPGVEKEMVPKSDHGEATYQGMGY